MGSISLLRRKLLLGSATVWGCQGGTKEPRTVPGYLAPNVCALEQPPPTSLAPGTGFTEDNFSTDWGRGECFRMSQAHYIYCALYFYYHYIVIYNETIIQLTTMLTGGGAQAVMRAMGSGCKYR